MQGEFAASFATAITTAVHPPSSRRSRGACRRRSIADAGRIHPGVAGCAVAPGRPSRPPRPPPSSSSSSSSPPSPSSSSSSSDPSLIFPEETPKSLPRLSNVGGPCGPHSSPLPSTLPWGHALPVLLRWTTAYPLLANSSTATAPLVPVEKLSRNRKVSTSRVAVVPPDVTRATGTWQEAWRTTKSPVAVVVAVDVSARRRCVGRCCGTARRCRILRLL
jgi:hypothetical protein